MASFNLFRIIVTFIVAVTAVLPIIHGGQGTAVAVPIGSLFRSIDMSSLASPEAWPNYNQTRPTTMRTRTNPVVRSAIFDGISGKIRFIFGFDMYAQHVLFLFGALLISKLALQKNQIRVQEEKDRSIAKEHIKYLERNHLVGSGHMRTRRGYYVMDDVIEVIVI